MTLQRTFDLYRRAVSASRDEGLSKDAQARAVDEMVSLRHELDAAYIARLEPAGVSQDRAGQIIGGMATATGPTDVDLRTLLDRENPRSKVDLLESRANEEWWKDVSSTVKAGYSVPTTVLGRVVYHINATSGCFGPAYKFNTATGEDITVPVLATDASATLTAEKTASTITNPVFGSETLKSYRLDGHFLLSDELLRDSAVNVQQVVGDAAGRAIATLLASYLATGSGSGEPEGVTVGSALGVTAASQTVFTFDEITELYYSVLPGARKNGVWVVSSDSILSLARMKDGEGRFIWQPAIAAGQPETLLGKPIYEDAAMPSIATTTKPVVFGDLGNYFWIRTVTRGQNGGGIQLDFSQDVGFTSFTTYVRFALWVDSRVMGTGGEIKHLVMA